MTAAVLPISALLQVEAAELMYPEDLSDQLLTDLREHYGAIRDVRSASITDIWRIARDLVLTIDRWAAVWGQVTGAEKMDIAVGSVWAFISDRGGLDGIRDRIAGAFGGILPGIVKRFLVGRILSDSAVLRLIRFVLELAVREIRDIRN